LQAFTVWKIWQNKGKGAKYTYPLSLCSKAYKTKFLCYQKAEYPNIVEKLNSRRIPCCKQIFPQA